MPPCRGPAGWLAVGWLSDGLAGWPGWAELASWLAVLIGFGLFGGVSGLPGAGRCIGVVAALFAVQWPVWGYES